MTDDKSPAKQLSAAQRRDLLRRVLERKAGRPEDHPLSLAQEALWFLDQLEPGCATYSFYPAVRIRGHVDLKALQWALGEIIKRHDTLRSSFPEINGKPVQRIAPVSGFELPIVDLSSLPVNQRESEARRLAEQRPAIDLLRGPVFRPQVLRLAADEFVLMLHVHHIVFDGWSLGVLAREMSTLYRARVAGEAPSLPELPIRYVDFARWQRQRLQGATLARLHKYWQRQLAGVPPLDLPIDHPRPRLRTSRGSTRAFLIPRELSQAVIDFSRRQRVTPFMTLLAAFIEVLGRLSDQEDFAVGTPIANRLFTGVEPLVGYFINMLVLRADRSGDPSFGDLVERVRRTALAAYEHQELTLDKVVEAAAPRRDPSRHPLFQVMFVLQNNRRPPLEMPDLQVSTMNDLEREHSAKFELTVPLRMTSEGFSGKINFNTDLFDAATIDEMIGQFQLVLSAALAQPDRPLSSLPLLSDKALEQVLKTFNDTDVELPGGETVLSLFEQRAAGTPNAEAVVHLEQRWSYAQLNSRAGLIAQELIQKGIGPGHVVGVCVKRSPELVAATLGVLKAGAAFLPLDLSHSRKAIERFSFVVREAEAKLIIADRSCAAFLNDVLDGSAPVLVIDDQEVRVVGECRGNSDSAVGPASLAYIVYTSGSAGRPKGVKVSHGNVLNAYYGWDLAYGLSECRSHLQMAGFGFDVFIGDLVRALCSGGKLVICPQDILLAPAELHSLMVREHIAIAEFVPVVLRLLIDYLQSFRTQLPKMRLMIVGSDMWYAVDHKRARRVLEPNTRLVNSYGLTEATIDSSYFEGTVDAQSASVVVPIGRPFANVRLYVLDTYQRPVPVGVTGELVIGGAGVSLGYVNRVDENKERFVKDPFSSETDARLCRTGDRARWSRDGQVELVGRIDDQVKIRGFRIEPAEVEAALREHPSITEAAVIVCDRTPGDSHLVAYFCGDSSDLLKAYEIRRFLSGRVPDYMVPSAYVRLDNVPLTAHGKVDRNGLPAPVWERNALHGAYVAPVSATEKHVVRIWSEVLGIERIGVQDDFFDLGGNSLLALKLTAKVREELVPNLPLVSVFSASTVEGFAERIEACRQMTLVKNENTGCLVPLAEGGSDTPLYCIHGLGGHISVFLPLARYLAGRRPCIGLQARGLSAGEDPDDSLNHMAEVYAEEIRRHRPEGPIAVAGWSLGGLIALQAVRSLVASGRDVPLVVLFDCHLQTTDLDPAQLAENSALYWIGPRLGLNLEALQDLPIDRQWKLIAETAGLATDFGTAEIRRLADVCTVHLQAAARYSPQPYGGRVLLCAARDSQRKVDPRWKEFCPNLVVENVTGDHFTMLTGPHVTRLAGILESYLNFT